MTEKTTLTINHKILLDNDSNAYIVRETFGDRPYEEWRVSTFHEAEALVKERRKVLLEMIASSSEEARQAVEEARYIDNLRRNPEQDS